MQNAPDKYRVRIRMYRQGLGDCFLLTFPHENKPATQLMIDCGVVLGTLNPDRKMKKVAEDLYAETGGKVDVLVITHEHWDHLSGFTAKQAQAEFDRIRFGQLWLAWTEDEKNELANALRAERARKKAAAEATKKKLDKLGRKSRERVKKLAALLSFNGPEAAATGGNDGGGTEGALKYLKAKIKQRRTFKPGAKPFDIPGVDGVRVYVLGPPEDKARLRKSNPSKGQAYGLSLAESFGAALGLEDAEAAQPFAPSFRKRRPSDPSYRSGENEWRRIDNDWLAVGERLALQLDSDTNNTSLVLAFEFIKTGEVLLFVGDAQAGNWLSWDDYTWQVRGPGGEQQQVTATDLLARTIFYKVGHHGSHNATLREKGLERMTHPDLVAMMPVDEKTAHETKGWVHMPLPELCQRLEEKCAGVIRIDKDQIAGVNPAQLPVKSGPGKLYFDYFIP